MKILLPIVCAATLALSACAGNSITYYQLPGSNYQLPATSQKTPVQLKVILAERLNQGNLIYQDSPTTLHFAQQHLWADDLGNEISLALANELNRQSTRYLFTPENKAKATLTVYIQSFQGSYDGYIYINGYSSWQGTNETGQNFNVRIAQQGNGYSNMVKALAQGLTSVAQSIAPYN
ncbi:PqiC family protein [Snodgrassella alvi]|jgi:uncharacterized protein|uniref:PqiC family protein n=1 Tax=Snodgrassella alvi TaxID=1196083 RepID=UPI000C1E3D13|nr:ABC-type transport auxiliary lipoprotein family protein [Snodgrassella alvi]PIT48874.1 hypothetical protein BHC51_04255 [Snodgrassella alvi]